MSCANIRGMMNDKLKLICFTPFLVFFVLSFITQTANATYNPSNIISDLEFMSAGTMSEAQIQQFLIQKNSYLKDYEETRSNLMGYPERYQAQGKNAAHIIWWVANEYKLNPHVILATLQKEQSLITNSSLDQYGLDWAMGYGVLDDGDRDYDKQGFSRQIDWGSWQLRWNMDNANTDCSKVAPYCTNGYVTIDGQLIQLGNGATASLYRYTPHFHGNQNFYNIYTLWFGTADYLKEAFSFSSFSVSNSHPAVGEKVTATYRLKNNLSQSIAIDAAGIVGRLNNVYTGANRDLGWQGPITFAAGETKTFNFEYIIKDVGNIYAWASFNYCGTYSHYNNWGTMLSSHSPNLTITSPFSISPTNPTVGQMVTFSVSIKNNETVPIYYSALGLPVKYYDRYSYDAKWIGPDSIQAKSTTVVSGSVVLDKPGPYTYWASYQIGGNYLVIGEKGIVNLL